MLKPPLSSLQAASSTVEPSANILSYWPDLTRIATESAVAGLLVSSILPTRGLTTRRLSLRRATLIRENIRHAAMKIIRHFHHALILTAIGALALLNSGCEYAKKIIAKDQLNQGAILYNQGTFTKAQEFFRSATDTDPSNAVAWLYLGATMVKQYKADGDVNKELANETLLVYKKALELSEGNCANYDNAISYIASIYDDLGNSEEWRNWMLQRAEGKCVVSNEVKATTYYAVGVKYWNCSYEETTRYQDKAKMAGDPFHYRNMDYPDALADKKKAEGCAAKGLEYLEKAIQVDPAYVDAMFYKGLLYREQQKLTKDEARRKELASLSVKIAEEASALMKKKEAEASANPQG